MSKKTHTRTSEQCLINKCSNNLFASKVLHIPQQLSGPCFGESTDGVQQNFFHTVPLPCLPQGPPIESGIKAKVSHARLKYSTTPHITYIKPQKYFIRSKGVIVFVFWFSFFLFRSHLQCSGVTPGSALRNYCWWYYCWRIIQNAGNQIRVNRVQGNALSALAPFIQSINEYLNI